MSDRKYRQRGYQDEPREPRTPSAPKPQEPRGPRDPTEFRVTKTVGFTQTIRCTRCGNTVGDEIAYDSKCKRCGVDLRSCVQCESFDPGARFECRQSIPARVSPKDERNRCELFHPTVRVERETGSTAPTSARKAFDDLFK
jgi:hypothetical protein